MSSLAPMASVRSLNFTQQHPYIFYVQRPGVPGGLPAGGIEHRHVRRQLQLARTGLDAGERHDHPGSSNYYLYYGDNFKIECPTGSGKMMNLFEVSKEIADRLTQHLPAK